MGWSGPMTYRQYLAWQEWLNNEWNVPSRTDTYLMQLACVTARASSSRPETISLKDFKLEFKSYNSDSDMTDEEFRNYAAQSEASWLGFLGIQIPPGGIQPGESIQINPSTGTYEYLSSPRND